jgi:hypothetical protein
MRYEGSTALNRVARLLVAGIAMTAMATSSAPASADVISFALFTDFGIPSTSGTPAGGFYNVEFKESPSAFGAVSGVIERGGVVIATAPRGAPVLEATLQPGDVAHLFDPKVAGGLTATFTGYPTIAQAQCGATTISGTTAPGQPVIYARSNSGFGTSNIVNANGGYTVTFAKPIPPGAILYVNSYYTQLEVQPLLEVQTEFQTRASDPCLSTPPPPPPVPVTKCVVPNLGHKTLARARKLLARAHCKLGKVAKPKKHMKRRRNHKPVVVSQKPGAKKIMAAGSKVSVRLG